MGLLGEMPDNWYFLHLEFDIEEEVEILLGLSSAKLGPRTPVMQS